MLEKADKIYYTSNSRMGDEDIKDGLEGPNVIHIIGFNSMETLCGHVDPIGLILHETIKRPTCNACLEVWNYVKKHKL